MKLKRLLLAQVLSIYFPRKLHILILIRFRYSTMYIDTCVYIQLLHLLTVWCLYLLTVVWWSFHFDICIFLLDNGIWICSFHMIGSLVINRKHECQRITYYNKPLLFYFNNPSLDSFLILDQLSTSQDFWWILSQSFFIWMINVNVLVTILIDLI